MKELRESIPDPCPRMPRSARRSTRFYEGSDPAAAGTFDVDDPMGLPMTAYERTARELREGIDVLVETICG